MLVGGTGGNRASWPAWTSWAAGPVSMLYESMTNLSLGYIYLGPKTTKSDIN